MDKLGGFGLIVVGLALVLLGWLVQSGIVEFLLDIIGVVIIIGGAVVGIIGIVKLFTAAAAAVGRTTIRPPSTHSLGDAPWE